MYNFFEFISENTDYIYVKKGITMSTEDCITNWTTIL